MSGPSPVHRPRGAAWPGVGAGAEHHRPPATAAPARPPGKSTGSNAAENGLGDQNGVSAANGAVASAQPIFDVFLLSLEKWSSR